MTFVIAIDGPAAAGKGTLGRNLADALGLPYLDTGKLYRAVARVVLDRGRDPTDHHAAAAAARELREEDLDRRDLRDPAVDAAAAAVASIPAVRSALLRFQQNFAHERGGVLDGRDIGTVVFPAADVKLFVTASLSERAHRRWRELQQRGHLVDRSQVEDDLRERDARDEKREEAPLRAAPEAVLIDSTNMDQEQVLAQAIETVRGLYPDIFDMLVNSSRGSSKQTGQLGV